MTALRVVTDHGDVDINLGSDGGPSPRCMWDEFVCARSPERFVVFSEAPKAQDDAGDQDGDDAADRVTELFCTRHYVLTLAQLLELHLPHCAGDVADHVTAFGKV